MREGSTVYVANKLILIIVNLQPTATFEGLGTCEEVSGNVLYLTSFVGKRSSSQAENG